MTVRRLLTTLLAVLAATFATLTFTGGAALASDACTAGHNASGQAVYFCGVWVPSGGVPVYSSTSGSSTVVDRLHSGGTANWFFCSTTSASVTVNGYSSTSWARTIGDDHSAQGWVPAVYFSGAENYWNGLPSCGGGSSGGGAGCTAGYTASGTPTHYCAVWLPSGGVPVYTSTSTGSGTTDHLLHGGTVNWFSCQVNGSTVTVGGYTSSNWAKTVGDQYGHTGYVPAVYFAGAQNYWPGLPACGDTTPPPTPTSNACKAGHNGSGQAVGYCPVWVPSGGVPVYASAAVGTVVDHLHVGGSANWFYCRVNGGTATSGRYSSSNWAKTVGDDHGATGYVPAIYFTGAENYWVGLTTCASGGGTPPPPPPGGGPTGNGTLSCHGYSVPYTGLPSLTVTLLKKACALSGTYSWGGGHVGTPGPSYGHYDGQDPASLHDDQVLGMDCSGFVRYAYYLTTGSDALNGYTGDQWNEGNSMPNSVVIKGNMNSVASQASQLKVGDILFYGYNAGEHVAIYLGSGRQVNAYESGQPYGVTSTGSTAFWGAIRLW